MIMVAEKTYNITIADEEAERVTTIADLSKLICKKLYQDQIKAIKLIQKS
jgi:acyl carrier protein